VLHAQASVVQTETARRLAALPPSPDDVGRLHGVFGASFRVLPRFKLNQTLAPPSLFEASLELLGRNPRAVTTWFQRMVRVREGAERLDAVLLYAEALNGTEPAFRVAQLGSGMIPPPPDERWVGLPAAPNSSFPRGRLSLVAHTPGTLDLNQQVCGLFVDEWSEAVPQSTETTGVAFQFDQPNSSPPQAVLLAVPPDPTRLEWDLDTLEAVILETLDLARLRLVDLEAVGEVKHYLPALYFANNASAQSEKERTAVETDFHRFSAQKS
jgi:hypothetical protein